MFQTLPDAIAVAELGHRHQLDKAGFPYIDHPKRVLAHVQAMGAAPYVQIAAVLHDIHEDTPFSVDILKQLGFSPAVLELVHILSRKTYGVSNSKIPDDVYYAAIKANKDARMIKIADITDNSLPWRTSYLGEAERQRLAAKYEAARRAIGA